MPRKRPPSKPADPRAAPRDPAAVKRRPATENSPPTSSAHPPTGASTRYSVIPPAVTASPLPATLLSLERYLAILPDALASFPEAKVSGAIVRAFLADPRVELPLDAGLPAAIEQLVRAPPADDDWVPVVHFCALQAIVYDCVFAGRGGMVAFEAWTFERNLRLLRGPQYAELVAVQNPELLLMAYHARWSAFYRGCPLEVMEGGKSSLVLRLSYPPHSWPNLSRLALAEAFRAGLLVAGGKAPKVTAKELSSRVARFDVAWL